MIHMTSISKTPSTWSYSVHCVFALSGVLEMPKLSKLKIATMDESVQKDLIDGDWQVS